jgi:hypothetical protein
MQRGALEFHVGPLKLAKITGAQAMPEADQDVVLSR